MKECSRHGITKMQIKKTMTYHYTSIRMAKIQNSDNSKYDKDVEQEKPSFIVGVNDKWYNHFGRQLGVPYKAKHILTT